MLCVIRCKKEINRFVEIFVWSSVDYIICLFTIVYENPNEFQLNILSEKKTSIVYVTQTTTWN